ncbi:MAG: ABC transporter ATP-binding protein [Lachnospiraceae bacterium]|nr:ABC transporter ATP-binding protein [Lachnospiraceae bacterium]
MLVPAGLNRYLEANQLFPRITVRVCITARANRKCADTSFQNLLDERFLKLKEHAVAETNSNQGSTEAVWKNLELFLRNLLGFVVYLLLMERLPFWIPILLTALSLAVFLCGSRLSEYRYKNRDELQKEEKKVFYLMEYGDVVAPRMMKDIRIFGLKPWIAELSEKALRSIYDFHRKASARELAAGVLDLLLTFLRNGLAYAYLIRQVLAGNMDIASFLLLFTAIDGFAAFVSGIAENLIILNRHSLNLSQVREFLEFPEPFRFEDGEEIPEASEYTIELSHVSYRYPGAESDALHDVSLCLHPGEKLAVVGLNGAGKTTLVKLLSGFLDPTEGTVTLNGTDIREFNREKYYELFSAVFQEFNVLGLSVAENIAQTTGPVDREKLWKCISDAGLSEKINALPEKERSLLNRTVYPDAVEFSGGETQRLILARALYKDAPFVFLDEPTAALDPLAEEDIYRKYGEFTKGKSSLFISHRLASTRFCDRILMIADGKIAEEGTHEELVQKGGIYAELFEVQAKYYQEDAVEGGDPDVR